VCKSEFFESFNEAQTSQYSSPIIVTDPKLFPGNPRGKPLKMPDEKLKGVRTSSRLSRIAVGPNGSQPGETLRGVNYVLPHGPQSAGAFGNDVTKGGSKEPTKPGVATAPKTTGYPVELTSPINKKPQMSVLHGMRE
jgi:hypothetical protein